MVWWLPTVYVYFYSSPNTIPTASESTDLVTFSQEESVKHDGGIRSSALSTSWPIIGASRMCYIQTGSLIFMFSILFEIILSFIIAHIR